MKTNSILLFVTILVAVLACRSGAEIPGTETPNVAVPATEAPRAEDLAPALDQANRKVDDFFAGFVDADTPGGVVIVLRDGKTLYQAAHGLANLEQKTPLTTDHMLHIASVGKQMTALAIIMLMEQGKLSYDDPVGKLVPELDHFGVDFTIRRLLNHTSGLPDYNEEIENGLYARAEQPTNADLLAVLSEMDGPPEQPGEFFEYSNPGYDLLAIVIERASGQPFPEFMQMRIFDRLGMAHTFSLPNESRRADPLVAISYTGSSDVPEAYPSDPLDGLYGSGSIYTTVGDMALYDQALYAGSLVRASALHQGFQPTELNDGSTEPYGFGWELETWQYRSYIGHSGAWLGFNSDYVRFLDQRFSVIVLLNRDYEYPDDPRIALQIAKFYLNP